MCAFSPGAPPPVIALSHNRSPPGSSEILSPETRCRDRCERLTRPGGGGGAPRRPPPASAVSPGSPPVPTRTRPDAGSGASQEREFFQEMSSKTGNSPRTGLCVGFNPRRQDVRLCRPAHRNRQRARSLRSPVGRCGLADRLTSGRHNCCHKPAYHAQKEIRSC